MVSSRVSSERVKCYPRTVLLQAALAAARSDKGVMNRNMKKTEAILRDMVLITVRSDLTDIQRKNLETCITGEAGSASCAPVRMDECGVCARRPVVKRPH